MSALTRDHTTTSSPSGMTRPWTVFDGSRAITLHAPHTMHLDMPGVPDALARSAREVAEGAEVRLPEEAT